MDIPCAAGTLTRGYGHSSTVTIYSDRHTNAYDLQRNLYLCHVCYRLNCLLRPVYRRNATLSSSI